MSVETKTNNWYKELVTRANTLSETFGLDDLQTSDLRTFVTTLARDQFKVGSKSGASWAYKQIREAPKNRPQVEVTA